jgi:signal-transduction protein with cAMP-binding, CBS, and nucleotidyltransferase domain
MMSDLPAGPATPLGELELMPAPAVAQDPTLREVAGLMVASGGSAVLVDHAHAIVTERDVVRAIARGAADNQVAVKYATSDPLLVFDSCRAIDALAIMLDHGVRNLMVVSEKPNLGPRLVNLAQVAAAVLRGTGLPPWLSGLRLALRVELT